MSDDTLGTLEVPNELFNLITFVGHHDTMLHIVREYHYKQKGERHYRQLETFCDKYQDFKLPENLELLEKHYLFNKFEKFFDKVSAETGIDLKEQDTFLERIQAYRMMALLNK